MDPMLAKRCPPNMVDTVLTDDAWELGQKVDGDRLIVIFDGKLGYRPLSRTGLAVRLTRPVIQAFTGVNAPMIVDGELLDDVFYPFDLPYLKDQIDHATPLVDRRAMLERIHGLWRPGPAVRLLPVARTTAEKLALVDAVRAQRGEGWVGKRLASPYRPSHGRDDRSDDWLKIKLVKQVDCVIDGRNRGSKANFVLGLRRRQGRRTVKVDVGEVSALTGDGPAITAALDDLEARGRNPFGKIVVTVTVLYATDDDRLYQAVKPRWRHDMKPASCTVDQLEECRTDRTVIEPVATR